MLSLHKTVIALFGTLLLSSVPISFAQKIYTPQERQVEEARIRNAIEEKLDWRNRTKETLDDYDDSERFLYGSLNESILLRQNSGERFGVFESFRDNGRKSVEIRLHTKNRLSDRYFLYGDSCQGAGIFAENVTKEFVIYETGCYTKGRNGDIEERFEQYLFDQASRNFYLLAFLDYDSKESKAPAIKLENSIYKMRWNVRLRGAKKNILVVRNFKILKDAKGDWTVKELPPIDDEAAAISPLKKLPIKPEYDLPAFVANWGKR